MYYDATRHKWLRYAARIIALAWAGWWTLFGLIAGTGEGLDLLGIVLHMTMPGLFFLAAALIAWRWELIGGVLLLLEALLSLAMFGFARTPEGFLVITLPALLSGALFLAARFLSAPPGFSGRQSFNP